MSKVTFPEERQGRDIRNSGGISRSYDSGERLPLLGSSKNKVAPAAAIETHNSNALIRRGSGGDTNNASGNNNNNTGGSKTLSKQTRTRQSLRSFRRKGRDAEFESWRGRIGVHVECDEFKLKELESLLVDRLPGWDYVNHYDVLRLWQRPVLSEEQALKFAFENQLQPLPVLLPETREVFIFSFGAVVFFNFPTDQAEQDWMQVNLFSICEPISICGTRHNPRAIESACDDIEFVYGETFSLKHDMCCFMTRDPGEKLAVSFALAKSSLLSIYEWTLEKTIARNSHITEHLAKTGTIPMHKEELSKEIGRIFLVRHMVNLDSDLQDTPEEFWEDDKFSFQYEKSIAYLEILKRFNLINNRLNMLQDLHEVLNEAVRAKHDVAMEWIIIWLIVVYLVIEFYLAGF